MDNEMIERCTKAMKAKRVELINKPLANIYDELTLACIKVMREPTEKMLYAARDLEPCRDPSEYWEAMIDSITND